MTRIAPAFVLSWALLTLPAVAQAQTAAASSTTGQVFRVDDSGTVVLDPVLQMQWQPAGQTAASPLVSASTRVSVQLNLLPWVGRTGRIYMTLPRTSGPTVRATWQTGGTLLPGELLSGDRTPVYAGAISGPILRDIIDIKLEADGARLSGSEALAFGFEIEVDP
ncbi:MAG: hypothetical protein H6916_03340 [Novosphingobium sp.]|uniref:hypothetical protein n=1 Tax=Novosphingobium sp. TaxID=1874826 RepID=UPI002638DDE0|nr:hypothetical protein [Novosphingobium sp.]MCP5385837.1 hypothetical protein [Novosphingobium sp.]